MKFVNGEQPTWKRKPKPSPLDSDPEFQKFLHKVVGGAMKPLDEAGIYVHQIEDGKRLGVKHPWRLVRDTLNRALKEHGLKNMFRVMARQTDEDHVWGVWATRLKK